jgi:hypothetical protein
LPIGSKDKIVTLPKALVSQGSTHLKYLIAGIFDSDGSVSIITKRGKLYPVLSITLKNKNIIKQIERILISLDIFCNSHRDKRLDKRINKFTTVWKLYINGFKNLKQFIRQIPIRNPNHLTKIKGLANKIPAGPHFI